MKWQEAEAKKNTQAENAHARKTAWGYETKQEAEEMGDTILGDIFATQQQAPQKNGLSTLAAVLLGLSVPTAGIAGYLFANRETKPDVQSEFKDATSKIGLGKIEDYE